MILGGSLRTWQAYIVVGFGAKFFNSVYPDDQALFSILNAASVLVGGVFSNVLAGYLADKYEPVNLRTKSYISCVSSFLSVPCLLGAFLVNNSFSTSMFALFMQFALAEGWSSPAISMMQRSVCPSVSGAAVAIYLFFVTTMGAVAGVVTGNLATMYDANQYPVRLGYICAVCCSIASFLAAIAFYIAGIFH